MPIKPCSPGSLLSWASHNEEFCIELRKTLQNNRSLMLAVLKIGAVFSPARFFFFFLITWSANKSVCLIWESNYFWINSVYSLKNTVGLFWTYFSEARKNNSWYQEYLLGVIFHDDDILLDGYVAYFDMPWSVWWGASRVSFLVGELRNFFLF